MNKIRMLAFDIDGVITDGKRYLCGDTEAKGLSLKDLDAIRQLKESGMVVGCISGEDTQFSQKFTQIAQLDFAKLGCKEKDAALEGIARQYDIPLGQICYVGDGKYDIPALRSSGLSVCPADAVDEVREVSNIVLTRKGGEGCIAETVSFLTKLEHRQDDEPKKEWEDIILRRMKEHLSVLSCIMERQSDLARIQEAARMVAGSYRHHGRLLLCGNGGSAADAQHLAGELVGRFYLERGALDAEALTTNTSVLTSLANDYDYGMIFARQVEAKASAGDVLIGITTSGNSRNIRQAFAEAKKRGVKTILLTGKIADDAEIIRDTDCLLSVPARDTPRIQEMHIMIGHIICELVEREFAEHIE